MAYKSFDLIQGVLDQVKTNGADAAEAYLVESGSATVQCRDGKLENTSRNESTLLGVRIFKGNRSASASTSYLNEGAIAKMIDHAAASLDFIPEDEYCGLAAPEDLMTEAGRLVETYDDRKVDTERMIEHALQAEASALNVAGVTKSTGGFAGSSRAYMALATTNGFLGEQANSGFWAGCGAIASRNDEMIQETEFTHACFYEDLEDISDIGRIAGEKAVRRLGGKKIETASMPVVYAPETANSLLGSFAGAISGNSVAMGTSFLKDKLSKAVFSNGITIIDDAHLNRGLGSRLFDGEGVATQKLALVENGVLQTWLLDSPTARQLGLRTNGHAQRNGGGTMPGVFNLYLHSGSCTVGELISDIDRGFYVTNLIGNGVNALTGDYSNGAAGFLIENGRITTPVKEISVAGNLIDMYARLTPANDLKFKYHMNSPTVRIDGMTVAGG